MGGGAQGVGCLASLPQWRTLRAWTQLPTPKRRTHSTELWEPLKDLPPRELLQDSEFLAAQ